MRSLSFCRISGEDEVEFLEQNEEYLVSQNAHLNFPDYSPEELTQILDLMLENRNTGWTKEQGKMLFHLRRCMPEEN